MTALGPLAEPDARSSLRLLIVSAEAPGEGHGSATALATFIQAAIARRDWHLTIVAPGDQDPHGAVPSERVSYLRLPIGRWPGRRWQLLRFMIAAVAACARLGRSSPDLVISWQPLPAGLAGGISARIARCPHVVRTCGPEVTLTSRCHSYTTLRHSRWAGDRGTGPGALPGRVPADLNQLVPQLPAPWPVLGPHAVAPDLQCPAGSQ
jgi:hypothetical protein